VREGVRPEATKHSSPHCPASLPPGAANEAKGATPFLGTEPTDFELAPCHVGDSEKPPGNAAVVCQYI